MEVILADASVGISELKVNPMAVVDGAGGAPVAVLNRNKPVAYIVPAETWERIHEALEDQELRAMAQTRMKDGKRPVRVTLSDL